MASTSRNRRDDIDIILDETDEEEDDLTGKPLNPPVGVTKQGGRTNRGAHDRDTNDSSDDDDVTAPSLASKYTSKWGQPTDCTGLCTHTDTGELGSSVSIVSGQGLNDQAIGVRFLAEAKGFFL
jgi:hypothetical protein